MNMNRFTTSVGLVAKVVLVGSSVALLGAACWKGVGTNTNVGLANENINIVVNTNTINVNINEDTNVGVNANVGTNTNTNTNSTGEIDTSDWVLYSSDELGLSFKYPKISGSVTEFQSDCVDQHCYSGSTIGWEYVGEGSLLRQYTLAASVSQNFTVDRQTWPTDYSDFYFDGEEYHLLGSTEIENSDKTVEVRFSGLSKGNNYIIYDLSSFSSQIDDSLSQAKVAMIKFPVGQSDLYKVFTIYFENPKSIDEVITSVESVKFE